MMEHIFELYLSGLYYGTAAFSGKEVTLRLLDLWTGKLGETHPMSAEEQAFYRGIFNIDFKKTAELLSFSSCFSGLEGNKIRLENGTVYARWEDGEPDGATVWAQRDIKFPMDVVWADGKIAAITVPSRERITVLVRKGYEAYTILKDWEEYEEGRQLFLLEKTQTVWISMEDGIRLSSSVILPKGIAGGIPAICVRTPYGKEMLEAAYYGFVRRGIAVVIQDVRGRNASEGEWNPMVHERQDGSDTIDWIAAQSWSDGNVGMIGGSYLGYVQWAAASSGNPHLKALVSFVTSGTPFADLPRKGGTMSSGILPWSFALSEKVFDPMRMVRDDWDDIMKLRPLEKLCETALGRPIPFLNRWFETMDDAPIWQAMDFMRHREHIKAPALVISGWYDDNEMGTSEVLEATAEYAPGNRKVILGSWTHSGNSNRELHGMPVGNNALRYDIDLVVQKWLDCQLLHKDNGIKETPMVEYYTVGSGKWKTAENWPVPNTAEEVWYLGSGGALREGAEEKEDSVSYLYDPTDETPYLVDVSENEFGVPGNYKEVDKRSDVLVFETEPLQEEMTITGDMLVQFYAGSSAPDTDWVVKTEHVDLEGNAYKMTDALLCARYREGFGNPQFMEKGQVYCFSLRTGKISETLFPGHRLRMTITSSAAGLCMPNSNTKGGYNSTETQVAENRIYFGGAYPSKLVIRKEF